MVKPEVVRRKVSEAASRLEKAESILSRPPEEFLADDKQQDLASFYLFCEPVGGELQQPIRHLSRS